MSKKITITISDENEEYFNKLLYELDNGDGKVTTNSQVINDTLFYASVIEKLSEQQLGAVAIALNNSDYINTLKYFLNSSYEKAE